MEKPLITPYLAGGIGIFTAGVLVGCFMENQDAFLYGAIGGISSLVAGGVHEALDDACKSDKKNKKSGPTGP